MTSVADDLRVQLTVVCTRLTPEALERVLECARGELGSRSSAASWPTSEAETGLAERMQSFERWREIAAEVGGSLPPGTSLVDTLSELRNARERVLAGDYEAGGEWPPTGR